MRTQRLSSWARIGGVALVVSALLIGIHWADAAEMTGTPKEMQKASLPAAGLSMQDGDGLVNHIGTLVAVSHDMDTVVVDIPLKDTVLRVGAAVTDNTKLLEDGKRIGLEKFEPGDEVRMQFDRVPDGSVAVLLERRPE